MSVFSNIFPGAFDPSAFAHVAFEANEVMQPGRVVRLTSRPHVYMMHPRDLVLFHVELCSASYERKCTMRERTRWEWRRRTRGGPAPSTWPELAAWAGVTP